MTPPAWVVIELQRGVWLSSAPWHYWASLAVALGALSYTLTLTVLSRGPWSAFVAGLVCYSFGEYAWHRWVAHGPPMRSLMGGHHAAPADGFTVPLHWLVCFLLLWWAVWSVVCSPAAADALTAGLLALHCYTEASHWLIHQGWNVPLARHHLHHHSNTRVNFSGTTTLWDSIFGTRRK